MDRDKTNIRMSWVKALEIGTLSVFLRMNLSYWIMDCTSVDSIYTSVKRFDDKVIMQTVPGPYYCTWFNKFQ